MQVAFNEEIDFLTKFMTVTINVLLFAELAYLVMPYKVKRFIQDIDQTENSSVSASGGASIGALFSLGLVKLQRWSITKDQKSKMNEGLVEKEFRRRSMFTTDMHVYQLVMISAILLSLNFILKLGRQKYEWQSYIEAVQRGKHPEKDNVAEKN